MQIKAPKDYGLIANKMKMDYHSEEDLTERLPFELKADDFIYFAELDMKGNSDKDVVNAVSNIKRAIENRMDCVLFAFNYQELSKNWNFPEKMEKLNKLGIIAPRILKKINRIRNLLEHQYQIPKKDEVEEAYDVATLFLAYTKNFVKKSVPQLGYYLVEKSGDKTTEIHVKIIFENDGAKIGINDSEYHVKATDSNFDEWVKFAIECCY